MDSLLAKLSEQKAAMHDHNKGSKRADEIAAHARVVKQQQNCNSLPPALSIEGPHGPSALTMRSASDHQQVSSDEIMRLRLQLAHAQNKISLLDNELAHTRSVKSDSSQILSVANTDPDYSTVPNSDNVLPTSINGLQVPHAARSLYNRESIWSQADDSRLRHIQNTTGSIGRSRGMWLDEIKQLETQQAFSTSGPSSIPIGTTSIPSQNAPIWPSSRPNNQGYFELNSQLFRDSQVTMEDDGRVDRLSPDNEMFLRPIRPGNRSDSRTSNSQNLVGYSTYSPVQMHLDASGSFATGTGGLQNINANGLNMFPQFQQPPIGTPLSPHATDFGNEMASWKTEVCLLVL
ncbi:hypothetical protein SEPCBS57363_002777 [Sporothrix epigloea]|uniref:Uncharacterized protein n=1 Tax=Sporothrix epigloea TaxID=1892477 RepID=A0ABP0DJK2_9PEZI